MSLQIFKPTSLIALALLAGCGGGGDGESGSLALPLATEQTGPLPAGRAAVIGCAIGAGAALSQSCTIERAGHTGDDLFLFVLRLPDGGFWRVRQSGDGQFATADGADRLIQSRDASGIMLTVRGMRFLVPSALVGS